MIGVKKLSSRLINNSFIQTINVSVIIPTRNRETELKTCLKELEKQTRKPNQILVISESDSKEKFNVESTEIEFNYLYFDKRIGPSALRNIGIQKSSGEIIVFLDDDAIPHPDFIEHILQPFEDPQVGIIRGNVKTTNSISKHFAPHYNLGEQFIEISPRLMLLCCMAVRRNILEELGGFNEAIPYGHEEADLCYRASNYGHSSFYAPKAIVQHNYSRSTTHYLKKRFKWGEKRHQLRIHDVKMIGAKRIILNLFPILALVLLVGFFRYRLSPLLYGGLISLFIPLFFWIIRGLIKFRSPYLAFFYGLGEISSDIGFFLGFFTRQSQKKKNLAR